MGFLFVMPGLRKLVILPWPVLPGSQEERKRWKAAAVRDLAPRRLLLWAQLGTNAGVREEGCGGTSEAQISGPESPGERIGSKDLAPWGELRFQSGQ